MGGGGQKRQFKQCGSFFLWKLFLASFRVQCITMSKNTFRVGAEQRISFFKEQIQMSKRSKRLKQVCFTNPFAFGSQTGSLPRCPGEPKKIQRNLELSSLHIRFLTLCEQRALLKRTTWLSFFRAGYRGLFLNMMDWLVEGWGLQKEARQE